MAWYPAGALLFLTLVLVYLLAGQGWRNAPTPWLWFASLAAFVVVLVALGLGWFATAGVAALTLIVLARITFFGGGKQH